MSMLLIESEMLLKCFMQKHILARQHVYDLVSVDGKSGRSGLSGLCFTNFVLHDGELPLTDPAPRLMALTPDGKYLASSCPRVGIA